MATVENNGNALGSSQVKSAGLHGIAAGALQSASPISRASGRTSKLVNLFGVPFGRGEQSKNCKILVRFCVGPAL